jgi:hypothetical protein
LKVLVLLRLPRPQLLVHSSQRLHSDQWPSTTQRWTFFVPSSTFQLKVLTTGQSTGREEKLVSIKHMPIDGVQKRTWTQLILTVSSFWIWPLAWLPAIGWKRAVAQSASLLDALPTGDTAGPPGRPGGKSSMNYKESIALCLIFCK